MNAAFEIGSNHSNIQVPAIIADVEMSQA